VVDAVGCLAPGADPPDTGSLASDLRSLLESKETLDGFRLGLMRGVLSALPRHPDLAQVFRERFVAQRARMLRGLFERAASRGEIPKDRDLDLLASVFPAMLCHRAFVAGQPVDLPYLRRVVEHILLPLATAQGATARPNDPIARPPSAAEATAAKDRPACP
ncbi:MAG: TetR-like C-terminal domain-containing protein, partial [Acidimicrobiales bacterium]